MILKVIGFEVQAKTKKLLQLKNICYGLKFAKEHKDCTIEDWNHIIFIDKTRSINFSLMDAFGARLKC